MNKEAETQMKKYLNLPLGYKASFEDMYVVATRFEEMTKNDQSVTALGMIYWLDIYGNFTEKKDKYSVIVNKMFTRMGKDMVQIFDFIELCANNYEEEIDGD